MKRRAIYAMLLGLCMCLFFSTAKTNSNIGKEFCCRHATIQKCAAPCSEEADLDISLIHYVLLKI
jgi:hypothetical protein